MGFSGTKLWLILFALAWMGGCVSYTNTGTAPQVVDRNKPAATPAPAAPNVTTTPTPLPIGEVPTPVVALPQTQVAAAPVAVPPAAQSLVNQAKQFEQNGDLAMAAASLERALRIAPNSAEVYYQLARVRQMQGQRDQAVQFARRGLAAGSADADLQAKLQAIILGN